MPIEFYGAKPSHKALKSHLIDSQIPLAAIKLQAYDLPQRKLEK